LVAKVCESTIEIVLLTGLVVEPALPTEFTVSMVPVWKL